MRAHTKKITPLVTLLPVWGEGRPPLPLSGGHLTRWGIMGRQWDNSFGQLVVRPAEWSHLDRHDQGCPIPQGHLEFHHGFQST